MGAEQLIRMAFGRARPQTVKIVGELMLGESPSALAVRFNCTVENISLKKKWAKKKLGLKFPKSKFGRPCKV